MPVLSRPVLLPKEGDMDSTFATHQAPNDQVALDLNFNGDADTMAGVEPWMQEMLNEHFLCPNALDSDSVSKNMMAVEPETVPSALAMNDTTWMNAQTWPALSGSSHDIAHSSNDQFLAAGNQDSFNSSTNLDFDLSEFLTEHATGDRELVSNDVCGQQNFGSFPQPLHMGADQDDYSQSAFNHVAAAFRELARARAAADPRPLSRKQKQRDASIALYLERLRDACDDAVAVITSSNTSNRSENSSNFNSPDLGSLQGSFHSDFAPLVWGQSAASENNSIIFDHVTFPSNSQQSSPQDSLINYTAPVSTPNSASSPRQQQTAPQPVAGGIEMVMDLNMNAATTLPRRHRPRTQAQREQYLAVRNRGACEKHKRQHKRCTCVDKDLTSLVNVKQSTAIVKGVRRSSALQTTNTRTQTTNTRTQATSSSPTSSTLSVESNGWCVAGQSGPETCECTNCKEYPRSQLLQCNNRNTTVGRLQQPIRDPSRLKDRCKKQAQQSQSIANSDTTTDKSRYSPHGGEDNHTTNTRDRTISSYQPHGDGHYLRATVRITSSQSGQVQPTGPMGSQLRVPTLQAFGTLARVLVERCVCTDSRFGSFISYGTFGKNRGFENEFTIWAIIWAVMLIASMLFKGSLG